MYQVDKYFFPFSASLVLVKTRVVMWKMFLAFLLQHYNSIRVIYAFDDEWLLLLQDVHLIRHEAFSLILLGGEFYKKKVEHCVDFVVKRCLIEEFVWVYLRGASLRVRCIDKREGRLRYPFKSFKLVSGLEPWVVLVVKPRRLLLVELYASKCKRRQC